MVRRLMALMASILFVAGCTPEKDTAATDGEVSTLTAQTPAGVRVKFEGLVTHVLGDGVERAVVLRVPSHPGTISLPASMKSALETALGSTGNVSCGSTCEVTMDGLAFRIVDSAGNPGGNFRKDQSFSDYVTKLKDVPAPSDLFSRSNLHDEIFASAPPQSHPAFHGYFELGGGVGYATRFKCDGIFRGYSNARPFPRKVYADFDLGPGQILEVRTPTSSDWIRVAELPDGEQLTISNDVYNSVSHFDHYACLSKISQNGQCVKLPEVVKADPNCTQPHADVLGCSNSTWP